MLHDTVRRNEQALASAGVRSRAANAPQGGAAGPDEHSTGRPAELMTDSLGEEVAGSELEDEQELEKRRFERLERALREEPVDAGWARESEDAVTQVLASSQFGRSRLQALECRSSLCRVQVVHDDQRAQNGFPSEFIGQIRRSINGRGFLRHTEGLDGQPMTTLYLMRPGAPFPSFWNEPADRGGQPERDREDDM